MERLLRQNGLTGLLVSVPSLFAAMSSRHMRSTEPSEIIWWIFVASVSISVLPGLFGGVTGPLIYVVAIGGAAGCGWAWLLARSLFRAKSPIEPWTVLAVVGIVAVEAYWTLTSASTAQGVLGEMHRVAANAASFICIGALVMVLVEVLSGYNSRLAQSERRFRQIFATVFCGMVAMTLIWAGNATGGSFAAQWVNVVIAACGLVGVIGSRLAVNYRKQHPLTSRSARCAVSTPSTVARDSALARRVLDAIDHAQRFTTPDLKVADLAMALGEQDYKVTQCITGDLGYRNFNHLINTRRITHAKHALIDPENNDRSISAISFDCGFNSIGPFNRAFKQEVGMTPREFRAQALNA